ncbi:MAG: hypothetical protein ACPIOQ_41915, partial [Promethearchaeia archaeon]
MSECIHIQSHMYRWMEVQLAVQRFVCIYTGVCVCMCVCECMYVCVCVIYIHTHKCCSFPSGSPDSSRVSATVATVEQREGGPAVVKELKMAPLISGRTGAFVRSVVALRYSSSTSLDAALSPSAPPAIVVSARHPHHVVDVNVKGRADF